MPSSANLEYKNIIVRFQVGSFLTFEYRLATYHGVCIGSNNTLKRVSCFLFNFFNAVDLFGIVNLKRSIRN